MDLEPKQSFSKWIQNQNKTKTEFWRMDLEPKQSSGEWFQNQNRVLENWFHKTAINVQGTK